jgi:hypothetical protein
MSLIEIAKEVSEECPAIELKSGSMGYSYV